MSPLICAAAGLWLLGQLFAGEALWETLWPVLGYGTHAITLLSIFAVVTCPFVALLFYRYARVKADLVAGRNVIARWTVDRASFKKFSPVAEARDLAEKRGALYLIFFFVFVIFGAVALMDPEVALPILAAAVALALIVTMAFWFGNRIRKRHLQMRSGEIIVGTDGLLVNDVLHVWSAFLSWLVGADVEKGPPPILTITYGFWGRYGPQFVGVMLPIGPGQMDLALAVKERLQQALGKRGAERRRERKAHARSNSPLSTGPHGGEPIKSRSARGDI
jgi:hypothetical protein